jgi:hypothetical protein
MMRATAWTVLAFLSLLSAVAHGAQTLSDGPYVLIDKSSDWNAVFIKDGQPLAQKTAIGRKISVPAVASIPAFDITLRQLGLPEPAVVPLDEGTPLFVVADTHGEFEIAIALLRAHKIIDESLRWSFGKGHLVLLGDIFDRGAHQTEILWLLFKLEQEARAAGGAVHVVLGNHESMVLLGDDRYLNPKYTQVAKLIGAPHYAALWSEQAYLGRWIRSKHTLMKIGDLAWRRLAGGRGSQAHARCDQHDRSRCFTGTPISAGESAGFGFIHHGIARTAVVSRLLPAARPARCTRRHAGRRRTDPQALRRREDSRRPYSRSDDHTAL